MTPSTKLNPGCNKKHFYHIVSNIIAWLQIVASPFFAGMIVGLLMYTQFPGSTSFFIALFTSLTGLIIGISWATKIWTREATLQFMSRIIASKDLDENRRISGR